MNNANRTARLAALACLTIGSAAGAGAAADQPQAQPQAQPMDHAGHDMSGHDMSGDMSAKDELGRSMYGMKHPKMDAAMTDELRANVGKYRNASDAEIALSMDNMGHEYAWYISPASLKAPQGVLILSHGFGDQGDQNLRQQVASIGDVMPTAMGIGMAMMMSSHIQVAVDELKAAGATEIVVVPVTSSAQNELYRQWLYIFGRQQKAEFASVPRIKTDLKVSILDPPGDNPLVAETLLDYAMELSTNPKQEVVIIAGHGPTSDEDNAKELKLLANLAKSIKADGGFADVQAITLQDDAMPDVREANVQKFRGLVESATKSGKRVIIVTNLIGARTIQGKLRQDLKGLDFEFNPKGIAQHQNFMKWMRQSIQHEFEKSSSRQSGKVAG